MEVGGATARTVPGHWKVSLASQEFTMYFQVRTDNHIPNNERLTDFIRGGVEAIVHPRFSDRVRRVEVYLQDTNGHKKGVDTRCSIEVMLSGHQPVAVDAQATCVDAAVDAALAKMTHALDRTIGRLDDRNGRVSMSGEPT
jgi:hypothetical protein